MKYQKLDAMLMGKKGVTKDFKEEWQWTRYMLDGKLFLAVCKDGEGKDSLITLKLTPDENIFFRQQYPDIIPGYYSNKVHWSSIKIEGDVPEDVVMQLAARSYDVLMASLSKKRQKEILAD